MAGVNVGESNGKRRSLDSELNLLPMIDLLMVTVAFLMITAAWSQMARVDASAHAPSVDAKGPPETDHEPTVHVDLRNKDHFVVSRRVDGVVVDSRDVERRFSALASTLATEWRASGIHKADLGHDRVVLHTSNDARYDEIIAAMDAVYSVKRPLAGDRSEAAYAVVFAVD